MSTTITLDTEGRLLLPAAWRDQLSLKGGARLRADFAGGKIELTPEPEESVRLVSKRGLMVITGIKGPVDAVAAIEADRREREDRSGDKALHAQSSPFPRLQPSGRSRSVASVRPQP